MTISDMPTQEDKDYEAEAALRTIIEAERIEGDEKLMSRVGEAADRLAEEASRVAQQHGNKPTPTERHPDRDRKNRTEF